MKILGIETSCDESSAAVVEDGDKLLSNVVASSIDLHKEYGGVVPEIAARSHIEAINPVIRQALTDANCDWGDIDSIAVTYGPGLGGSLLVGVLTARTLAIVKNKPLFPVNHVQAHVYASFLTKASDSLPADSKSRNTKPEFPLLALIISGGHTQIVLFQSHSNYKILGKTNDDAVGEAFDKVAKILGLSYPGGPSISQAALNGDAKAYKLPQANMKNTYDFSFSGLKTAVLRSIQKECGVDYSYPSFKLAELLNQKQRNDFAASFEQTAVETLVNKLVLAYKNYSPASVVLAGGVAANKKLQAVAQERIPTEVTYPKLQLCTDNAAMIASLAFFQSEFSQPCDPKSLDIRPSLSM